MRGKLLASQYPLLDLEAPGRRERRACDGGICRWTNFRGTLKNTYLRGISHGDMIDLAREDYKGFDVMEFYIHLAEGLKERGL